MRPQPFEQLREILSGLDPSLPDLVAALDPEDAATRLQRRLPGPHSSISACALHHVRWSPGTECVATYRLTLASPSGETTSTIGVVAVGAEGVEDRLYTEDADLPGLSAATDPSVMSAWLAQCLDRRVDSCSITLVRYRHRARCVLRYEVPGNGAGNTVVYGKVMAGGAAARLATTADSLGGSLVAPVVGVSPQWHLVVQADAGERSLRSVVGGTPSATGLAELHASGRLLARLHARKSPPGPLRSLAEDVEDLEQNLEVCRRLSPSTAERLADGIDRLDRLAGPGGRAVPSHGAFRLDQVHVTGDGPLLIDLDSYCWADPARDIGNLRAYLGWRAIRLPDNARDLARVRDTFLEGYADEAVTQPDEERVGVFEVASLLKIASRRYRRLAMREWDLVPTMIDAAFERLAGGTRGG